MLHGKGGSAKHTVSRPVPGEPKKNPPPTTFVDITAMHGNFCTKFYTIVKRSNIHFITKYHKLQPKPKTIDELKVVLQTIWRELPQAPIDKAVASFTKRLTACAAANGGHFEHVQ